MTYLRRGLLIACGLGVAALVPLVAGNGRAGAGADAPVREIQLVVRDMTFYVAGDDTPNPTLRARAGERVRLVLHNTDAGMSHDFTIPAWRVKTRLLKGKGEDRVEFTVPATRGPQPYSCNPHAEMMSGTILVD